MKIIEIEALNNGAHRNQSGSFTTVPEGWAIIPEDMATPDSFPFVNITTENGIVTSISEAPVPEPEDPEDEDTETNEDMLMEMAIDHEYRLTLLELGMEE